MMDIVVCVLREIERQAEPRHLPIIGVKKSRVLAGLVEEVKPIRALEVGACIGYSAFIIACHMNPGARLTTIEIDPDLARETEENLSKAGLAERVEVLNGNALNLIPTVEGPIDLAFMDAEKQEYGRYLQLIEPLLHTGSVVVADNAGSFARAMRGYLNHVRGSGMYESRYISVGWDGLEVSRRL